MKKIIILAGLFICMNCSAQKPNNFTPVEGGNIEKAYQEDSLLHVIDSLRTKLFIANYKIERVRYYNKICIHNPKQTKFLTGWILRAVQ